MTFYEAINFYCKTRPKDLPAEAAGNME